MDEETHEISIENQWSPMSHVWCIDMDTFIWVSLCLKKMQNANSYVQNCDPLPHTLMYTRGKKANLENNFNHMFLYKAMHSVGVRLLYSTHNH